MLNTIVTHVVSVLFLGLIGYLSYGCLGCLYLTLSGLACFSLVAFLLASYVDNALPRFRVTAKDKAVFITGCDKGFGRMLARRLDSMGYKVFAGCLEPDGDEVQKLTDTISSHLEIVPLDVTNCESVQNALKTVESKLGHCGRHTFSGFVPYCMSKHATTSFCDGLRMEMKKFGVKVVTVEPFSYQTDMTEMKTVLKSIDDTWRKCPAKLKEDVYDADYTQAFSDSVRKFNETTALPNTDQVIDLLVEAVCAVSPHYSYVPGNTECLLNLWMSRRLPKTFVDYFVRKRVTFDCDLEEYLKERELKKKNS